MINIGDYKQSPSNFKKFFAAASATPPRRKFGFRKNQKKLDESSRFYDNSTH